MISSKSFATAPHIFSTLPPPTSSAALCNSFKMREHRRICAAALSSSHHNTHTQLPRALTKTYAIYGGGNRENYTHNFHRIFLSFTKYKIVKISVAKRTFHNSVARALRPFRWFLAYSKLFQGLFFACVHVCVCVSVFRCSCVCCGKTIKISKVTRRFQLCISAAAVNQR